MSPVLPSLVSYISKASRRGGKTVPPGLSGQQQNEDCLFLDVISPSKVFAKGRRENHGSLAPVLFNIHGGGYFSGDKTAIYNPRGLLERGKDDFVYVSINYRLGAFGFLAAVEPSSANYTSPNAGFLDQRYALKWVQKYIHLFGGDPQQVTITGESSGGTSVLRHLVAYGGSKPEESGLFIRGVVQSPSLTPIDPQYLKLGANLFLQSAGVSTVDEARNLSTEVLQKAQKQAQVSGPFNVQFFTPVVDDDVLLDYPTRLLKEGKYFKNVTMIAAHNFNEGRHFANQSVSTDADFDNWAYQLFLSTPNVAEKVIKEVYPPLYDGSLPYKNPLERLELCTMELSVACSTNAIGVVPELQSRNYLFSIDPGTHAQDLAYTYYPTGATPGFYPAIAEGLQEYLTHYILTGDLSHKMDLPAWPLYSTHAHVLNITEAGFSQAKDPAANNRCQYWNSVPYFAKPGQVADAHTNMTG
ncbi:uncharacterized protein KY384_005903 [Bacidia gigantensis]|uniref:uncharacterized protein n=1 Tax=Bacidia gigantensis TaxID=2732470 RepID=UPI001D05B546|nr:uncharacterized protein KY384_005903 [Bacidia gigantensis]KAG8529268.1 hypothetical protein KY384_005903 [Bacidia gigantensis]